MPMLFETVLLALSAYGMGLGAGWMVWCRRPMVRVPGE